MGMSKALMEKVMVANSRDLQNSRNIFCGTRYGNVMASRGSVIPLFIEQAKNNGQITITNPNMTRFMMNLSDAVNLVMYAFENGNNGEIFVQKSPATTIETLAKAIIDLYNSKSKIKYIGIRHGEKMYETLVTKEEMSMSIDLKKYYKIVPDSRSLNYNKYFKESNTDNSLDEYNSNNTEILNINEMKKMLLQLPEIKQDLNIT